MNPGTLHLIPVPIGWAAGNESGSTQQSDPATALPAPVITLAASLDYYIAENARTARAFLKTLPLARPIQAIEIRELNEHTPAAAVQELLEPILNGRNAGLVSEAGCPAVADPGSLLVAAAHRAGVTVFPHVGPSALLLTLMASGLNGQRFTFSGYLPANPKQRAEALVRLERRSAQEQETQLWIETPYRAQAVFETATQSLQAQTQLVLACNLASADQWIGSRTIAQWRAQPAQIADRLTVFALLGAALTAHFTASSAGSTSPNKQSPAPPKHQNVSPGAPQRSLAGRSQRRSRP